MNFTQAFLAVLGYMAAAGILVVDPAGQTVYLFAAGFAILATYTLVTA